MVVISMLPPSLSPAIFSIFCLPPYMFTFSKCISWALDWIAASSLTENTCDWNRGIKFGGKLCMILRFSKEGNVVLWGSHSLLGIRHNFHSRKTFLLRPPIIYIVCLQFPELLLLFLPRIFKQLMSRLWILAGHLSAPLMFILICPKIIGLFQSSLMMFFLLVLWSHD